jgi:ATP phosphoribosyltransferase
MNVSDFIVDLVSSGSTLKTNRLVEIHPILYSQAVAIASKTSLESHRDEIYDITNAIKSVMNAESKKYLMADIPKDRLKDVQSMFPGLAGPTVMNIAGRDDMVAIHVVIDARDIYDAVNSLQKLGGKGILTLPIDRLVL